MKEGSKSWENLGALFMDGPLVFVKYVNQQFSVNVKMTRCFLKMAPFGEAT